MALGGEFAHVRSGDGTRIGVERVGTGPDLVAVHGSTSDRSRWASVAALAEWFTLHVFDRRGRGDSREEGSASYALDREVEDLLAVIGAAGGPVRLLGHSYGGLIALSALPRSDRIVRALIYEPPFGPEILPSDAVARTRGLVEAGEPEAAVDIFYRDVMGVDPTPMKALPDWPVRVAAAPTLGREFEALAAYTPDREELSAVGFPVRLLIGTTSPPPFRVAVDRAAEAVPGAEVVELPGQGHMMIDADPEGFVAQVRDFLG
jgi:pimeloyl-ACP methyl ester carboxylesterase